MFCTSSTCSRPSVCIGDLPRPELFLFACLFFDLSGVFFAEFVLGDFSKAVFEPGELIGVLFLPFLLYFALVKRCEDRLWSSGASSSGSTSSDAWDLVSAAALRAIAAACAFAPLKPGIAKAQPMCMHKEKCVNMS